LSRVSLADVGTLHGRPLLTPKFGTRRSLICGPSLVKKIRLEEGRFLRKDSAEELAVGSLLPFGKGTVCADFARLRGDVA
jgi:hypothetical protein